MAGSLTWNTIVIPSMFRFGIGPCLIVSFFASLSTRRISPSVNVWARTGAARVSATASASKARFMIGLLFRNDLAPADHPALEMARGQAAVAKFTRLRELPDDFGGLARRNVRHVPLVVFHPGMLPHQLGVCFQLFH